MGRHTTYSNKAADEICEKICTTSEGLVHIAKELGISTVTIYKWLSENEYFANNYARAREIQADFVISEGMKIVDNNSRDDEAFVGGNHVQRARLQWEARKWQASKLAPKKYGDKIDIEHSGDVKVEFKDAE